MVGQDWKVGKMYLEVYRLLPNRQSDFIHISKNGLGIISFRALQFQVQVASEFIVISSQDIIAKKADSHSKFPDIVDCSASNGPFLVCKKYIIKGTSQGQRGQNGELGKMTDALDFIRRQPNICHCLLSNKQKWKCTDPVHVCSRHIMKFGLALKARAVFARVGWPRNFFFQKMRKQRHLQRLQKARMD